MSPLAFAFGAFTWTLAEYLLHRFLGHSGSTTNAFAKEHLEHHRHKVWFSHWGTKLRLAALIVGGMSAVLVPALGAPVGGSFVGGFVGLYLGYEALHRDLHVRAPRNAIGRFLRRHHMLHHHMDPRRNHGVTSPLWDLVFGTFTPSPQVRIGAAKTPPWLDTATDPVLLGDYVIRRGASL